MVDLQTVCCMCGDVGFPDKLFRCNKCRHRFQHSYCSNYYGELPEIELCDWCQSEEKNSSRHIGGSNSKKPVVAGNDATATETITTNRSEYSGSEKGSEKGKSPHAVATTRNTQVQASQGCNVLKREPNQEEDEELI